ncbi:MAG: hypothetical protein U1A78_08645 [Polyangia bacterium]
MEKKLQRILSLCVTLTATQALADPVVVEYGIKGGSTSGKVHRSFTLPCSNDLFKDPAPGAKKVCSVNGQVVASEGGSFAVSFTSDAVIEYGASKTVSKALLPAHRYHCGNDVFGDPAPSAKKSCYINGVKVADEGGYFNTPGPVCASVAVKYGARETYTTRNLCTGRSVVCGNGSFGDPLVGVSKSCLINGSPVASESKVFSVPGSPDCLCAGQPVSELNKQGALNSVNGS